MKKDKILLTLNGFVFILASLTVYENDLTSAVIFALVGLVNLISIRFITTSFLQTQIFINFLNAATSGLVAFQLLQLEKNVMAAMYLIATAGYLIASGVFAIKFRKNNNA